MESVSAQEGAIQRLLLLTEVSGRVGTSLDLQQTGREFVEAMVPGFADMAALVVLARLVTDDEFPRSNVQPGEGLMLRRIAHAPPIEEALYREIFPEEESIEYPPDSPNVQAMVQRRTLVFDEMTEEDADRIAAAWERPRIAGLLVGRSLLYVPLVARGAVIGVVVFGRLPGRVPFDDLDLTLAEEAAARTALCIDNARLYNRAQRTALTLQRTLLPRALEPPAGIEVTNRYLPGSDTAEVGGDWFDVIPLLGGRAALVVGDVMGHGVRAAAVMGQLRTAVRALARVELSPGEMLAKLDEIMQSLDVSHYATCVYAVYDPVTMRCTFGRAGHVPPAVLHPDGRTEPIDVPAGVPLGIGGGTYREAEIELTDGSVLAFCTDGLVESRDRDIDVGIGIMLEQLRGVGRTLDEIADDVVEALYHEKDRDDIALLLVRVRALSADRMASWELPPRTSSVGVARTHVREVLESWGLRRLQESALLLTSELVTNAIRHVGGPVRLRMLRDRTLTIEVSDNSDIRPELRSPSLADDGGRGLQLVDALSLRWGTRKSAGGKTVWLELALP